MSVLPTENNISMVGVGLLGRTTSGAGKSARLSAASVRSLCSVYSTAEVDTLLAGYQPLDADLTAIAALTTTTFGRSLLTQADAATARATLGAIGGTVGATTNRLVKSSGTDTLTVQSTGITVDVSNNVSGVGTISSGAITSSGNVLVNSAYTSSVPQLIVRGTNTVSALRLQNSTTGSATSDGFGVETSDGTGYIWNYESSPIVFGTTNTTRMTLSAAGDVTLIGSFTSNALICAGAYTVATLPSASANAGKFAQVTDSSVTTFGSTVSGGGSNRVPVFSNGTNWVVA